MKSRTATFYFSSGEVHKQASVGPISSYGNATQCEIETEKHASAMGHVQIVSAARSLTCRDDLDSKWRLLLAENELSRVSLLSRISIEN